MRATISLFGPWALTISLTRAVSSADSQLMMAPSASLPASVSIWDRSAATKMGGGSDGTNPNRNPCTEKVS